MRFTDCRYGTRQWRPAWITVKFSTLPPGSLAWRPLTTSSSCGLQMKRNPLAMARSTISEMPVPMASKITESGIGCEM